MNFDDLEIDLLPSPIHEKQSKSKYQRQRIPSKKITPRSQGKIKRGRPRSSKRREEQLETKRNTDSPDVLIIENSPPKTKTPKIPVSKLPNKKTKSSRSSSKQLVSQPQSLDTHRVKIATFNLEQIIGQWQLNLKKMLDSSVGIMNQLKANK